MTTNHDTVEMEIFRCGDYGPKGSYTEADLDAIASDYSPEVHEAPLTADDAQSGPALGWVAGVRRAGDRLVVGVQVELQSGVAAGHVAAEQAGDDRIAGDWKTVR